MSRAQDRSSGLQSGAQAPQQGQAPEQGTGATGTGMTTGAAATGQTGQPGQTGPTTRTTTTTTVRDRGDSQMQGASYERGMAAGTGYRPAEEDYGRSTGSAMGGVLAVVAGLLTFLAGLAVVVRQHFYPVVAGYAYSWNVRGWGWVLLALGALLFAAGACALLGLAAARAVGVGLAVLTAVVGFIFLVYSPFWSVIIVALSVIAIWGLLHDGSERRTSV